MTAVDRRFTFIIDEGVDLDLDEIEDEHPDEYDAILVEIEELQGDRTLCERLIDVGYEDDRIIHVKEFAALQARKYNAYTVRVVDADHWRLITAVDHRQRIIALLYIMRRSEEYDATVQRRVIQAYEKLGLKRLGEC